MAEDEGNKNPEKSEEAPAQSNLIGLALKAHRLRPGQCLATKEVNGVAILVTRGGQKIVWKPGQDPVEIPAHQHPDAKPVIRKKK